MNRHLSVVTLTLLLCCSLHAKVFSAPSISVHAAAVESGVQAQEFASLDYTLVEEGVATFQNGEWAALKVVVPEGSADDEHFIHISYALLDTVELWVQDAEDQMIRLHQTGQSFAFSTRPYASSDFVFPTQKGTEEYYFRIYSAKPVVLPVAVRSSQELFEHLTFKDFLFGMYAGLMLVMILYNLVLNFITRDKSYAYYIVFLISIALAQLALFGYTDRYLFPNSPELNQKYAVLSGAAVVLFTALFVIHFLQLRRKAPLFAKLIYAMLVFDAVGLTLLFSGAQIMAYHVVNFASAYGSIFVLIAAYKLSRSGFKPAKFLLIAWSMLIVSVVIFALTNLGVIPYRPYFHGAITIGSSIEAILLSVALADRINMMRRENELSQKSALELAQENARIVREQNLILEKKVEARTEALRSSNEDLKVALENLKDAQAKLVQSEKMASLGVLTAGVAHEINNPLNYIYGGFAAISEEVKKDADQINKAEINEYLSWIRTGVERATAIVKGLSAYSRSNDAIDEECNLHSILEASLLMLQPKLTGQAEIKMQLAAKPVRVKGNEGKLHQVVLNLLDNAIDAIETQGEIRVATEIKGDQVILTIQDNGSGISKEHLSKLLDPFFTTKPPGQGTGLGLSIVHNIIKEHGGTIDFQSIVGEGTTVTVTLQLI
jgi:hypothetical protein